MQNKILHIDKLSLNLKKDSKIIKILDDISFGVKQGSFTSIIGPSGCGKSTLLRLIAGLETSEHNTMHGNIERNFKKLSMVFQNYALFPWLKVRDNVAFGLEMSGMAKDQQWKIVEEKLEEVGLERFADAYPNQLSGGQKQRVSVARALAVSPDILLMDEPFSSLDSITAERLKNDVHRIWKKYQMTVLMVNHVIEDAVELSDEIIVLSSSPAVIKDKITIDLPYPRNRRSAEFFGIVDRVKALLIE